MESEEFLAYVYFSKTFRNQFKNMEKRLMDKNFHIFTPGDIDIEGVNYDIHNEFKINKIEIDLLNSNIKILFTSEKNNLYIELEVLHFNFLYISEMEKGFPWESNTSVEYIGYVHPEQNISENGFLLEDMIDEKNQIIISLDNKQFIRIGGESMNFSKVFNL